MSLDLVALTPCDYRDRITPMLWAPLRRRYTIPIIALACLSRVSADRI